MRFARLLGRQTGHERFEAMRAANGDAPEKEAHER